MSQADHPQLVRVIGRWSLAGLMINTIVGSGVFGLPSVVAGLLGRGSTWAVLIAGGAVGIVIACFAEVASRFTAAGGPYLYARAAFGRLVGIEVGWMFWLARLTAPAANANLFVTYLGEFWPRAVQPMPRFAILTLLIGVLVVINLKGVGAGTQISNFFTLAKLLPLFFIAGCGAFYLAVHAKPPAPSPQAAGIDAWLRAVLLLVFAYGGFEGALIPMSEAKNPRRDAAFGLFAALITCTLLYAAIQFVVVGVLPDPAKSVRPLADVAKIVLGSAGAIVVTLAALVSTYGAISANTVSVPRITFAFAESGDLPSIFSAVHPTFRTPYVSILVFGVLTWLLALLGNFSWNVTLSALARLFYYGLVCAALLVLRRKQAGAASLQLPAGSLFAVLGIITCLLLVTRVDLSGSLILLGIVAIALLNWAIVRTRQPLEKSAI